MTPLVWITHPALEALFFFLLKPRFTSLSPSLVQQRLDTSDATPVTFFPDTSARPAAPGAPKLLQLPAEGTLCFRLRISSGPFSCRTRHITNGGEKAA